MKSLKLLFFIILSVFLSCKQDNSDHETFNSDARNKIISSDEINTKIQNGKNIQYKDATITGEIDFLISKEKNLMTPQLVKHYVNSSVVFYNCTFKGKIKAYQSFKDHFELCDFRKNVTFINCTFQDSVNFTSSEFQDLVNFNESVFQEFTSFKASAFNYNKNYLEKTHFIKNCEFNMMHVNGTISFFKSEFDEKVIFQLSKFIFPVQFSASVFHDDVDFSNVKFYDDLMCNYSEFVKHVSFKGCVFKGRTEFIKSKFEYITEFNDCLFYGKTNFEKSEIKGIFKMLNNYYTINKPSKADFIIAEGTDFIE